MSMGFSSFQEDGNGGWSLSSKTDPRWNVSGRGFVGGFDMPEECKEAIKKLLFELGDPPEDLEWSYMKD